MKIRLHQSILHNPASCYVLGAVFHALLLFINHYSLFIIHHSLFIIHHSPFLIHHSLCINSLLTVRIFRLFLFINFSLFIFFVSSVTLHFIIVWSLVFTVTFFTISSCYKNEIIVIYRFTVRVFPCPLLIFLMLQ